MLFNSGIFLFWFLPITLALYYAVQPRWRLLLLLGASYTFYGWWNPFFCGLMFVSTCVDYIAGREIYKADQEGRKRFFLTLSILANLSLLGFFKYYGMLSSTLDALAGSELLPLWQIVLPIGISFYTFQSMSYSIDIYRGAARPTRGFIDFASYVALFPQLIAGPIVRYSELDEQLRQRDHTFGKAAEGASRFIIGLAKKVLIADALATVAGPAFASATTLDGSQAWLGILAYSFQIYFDFSGYSDMAIGLGLFFGFRFPENFKMPYHARSISEFWRRWHMTLSSWLRDYLYIPLGGNKKGNRRTLANLTIVMLLGGLWHGAAWTFVAWGLLHGILLVIERLTATWRAILPLFFQRALTFLLVTFGWVFFRAESFSDAFHYFDALFSIPSLSVLFENRIALFIVAAGALITLFEPRFPRSPELFTIRRAFIFAALFVVCVVVIFGNAASPFIYFQF